MKKKKQQKARSASNQCDVPAVLKSIEDPVLQQHLSKLFNGNEKLTQVEKDEMWSHLHFVFINHMGEILSPESDEEQDQSAVDMSDLDADQTAEERTSKKDKIAPEHKPKKSQHIECVRAILQLMVQSLSELEDGIPIPAAVSENVYVVLNFLNSSDVDLKFKNEIIQFVELWMKCELPFRPSMCIKLYNYLLEVTAETQKNVLKSDIDRFWKFRHTLLRLLENPSSECGVLVKKLSKLPENKSFIRSKDGCNFISFLFTINSSLVFNLHASVKNMLPKAKQAEAAAIGEILVGAWLKSSSDMRVTIAETCVQNLMSHVFTLRREGLEMNKLGRNVMAILSSFHNVRTNPLLLKVLTDLYEPLLWRYLASANNIHRCNAAQVFFSAYPLQRPGSGGMERSMFEDKQHNIISDLLKDDCHLVRLISISNVCMLMNSYYLVLPQEWIKRWMKILVRDLSVDSSTADVRRSVLLNVGILVANPHATEFMTEVVLKMKDQLHDVSEVVRKAFLQLVIKLREAGEVRFWDYAPLTHLLARLEVEDKAVGEVIVNIMFNSYCGAHLSKSTQLSRVVSLIVANQGASRRFFLYSRSFMPMARACELIHMILLKLHAHVQSCLALDKSITNSPVVREPPRLRSKKRRQEDKENISQLTVPEPAAEKPDTETKQTLDNPIVVQGLMDVASILWVLHMKEMAETKQEDLLYNRMQECIPTFLIYYRDNLAVYSSVLHLASLAPVNIVSQTCHVTSILLSQLKKLTTDAHGDVSLMLINPLCMWNRGGDIIELAQDWLQDAFTADDVQSLNRSRKHRVTFKIHQDPKPQLALDFLNAVFHYPSNQKKVIAKNYDSILELWNTINSVKEIIVERLVLEEPLENHLLNDAVLRGCLLRYANLIPILTLSNSDFDACQHYINLLNWAEESLCHFVPAELADCLDEVPLVIALLRDVIHVGQQLIVMGFDDPAFCMRLAAFVKLLICTGCSLMFVHGALSVITALMGSVKETESGADSCQLIRVVVPSLTTSVLSVLSAQYYPHAILVASVENLSNMKHVLSNVLMLCDKQYGVSSRLKLKLIEEFADAVVDIQAQFMQLPVIDQLLTKIESNTTGGSQVYGQSNRSLLSAKSDKSQGEKESKETNMPYLASQLMSIFISRPTLGNFLTPILMKKAETEFMQDKVAACNSLLESVLSGPGKLATKAINAHLLAVSKQATPSETPNASVNTSCGVPKV